MTRRGLLLFVAMSVIWGIPYLFIRVAVGELNPAVLVFARTGTAALILVPIALARNELRGLARSWLPLLAFAAIEVGIPWLALARAEQQISSSLAGLLLSAVPLVGVVIATSLGNREHLGAASLTGLLMGLVGVTAIVGFDLHASSRFAFVEIGVVAVGYAVGPVILSRYLAKLPSVGVMAVALSACALAYTPVAVAEWPHSVPSPQVIASVAVLAIVCTAVAFLLFFALIAEIGPVRATVITYINPAVAAVLGITILHESFTVGMAFGFVLVIAGSVLATRKRAASRSDQSQSRGTSPGAGQS